MSMLGSAPYSDLNHRLWYWKANGMVNSVLVNPFPYFSHRHIADILGYKDVKDMAENWNEKSTDTLKLLCGPHGFTIYKMLVIKWETKVNGSKSKI